MFIERFLGQINILGTPEIQKCLSCTEEEVSTLEQHLHLSLPIAYKEFLLAMGKGADTFLLGSDFLYPALLHLQAIAREMLAEDEFAQTLPADAFVFFMHQGYQFNFFHTSGEDDPPVFRYFAGKDQETFPIIYYHFTDFLLAELKDHAKKKAGTRALRDSSRGRDYFLVSPEVRAQYQQRKEKFKTQKEQENQ